MQKVNEERILHDYRELVMAREANLGEIERQARSYALARGYDEEKTEKFINYTKELEDNGLPNEESAKLELLASYIEEVEEPAVESASEGVVTSSESAETAGTTAATYAYGVMSNI